MLLINQVTSDPKQKRTLLLEDGTAFEMTMHYVPLQFGWFIRNITYLDFSLNNIRITNNPNMLHQFRNQIPFGLACFTQDNREPTQQEDFSSGASKLYVLTEEEVNDYQEFLTDKT